MLLRLRSPDWPLDFARMGRLNGTPVAMVANGPGPKLAGEAVDVVKEHQKMDSLISIGFCGGLQPSLGACDIFVATEVVGVGPALAASNPRQFKTGKLLSIDRVVSTAAEKAALAETARRRRDGSSRGGYARPRVECSVLCGSRSY